MPELPEVENFRKYLEGTSLQKKIVKIDIDDPKMVKVPTKEFEGAFMGEEFAGTDRIGKYLFIKTSNGKVMVMHFGLTGKLSYFRDIEDLPRFTRVLFWFEDGFKLAYICMRKFGFVSLTNAVADYKASVKLADDAALISFEDFYHKLKNRKSFIKPAIMDQKVVAGVGNWIADDVLYQSRIHPESRISHLQEEDLKTIFEKIKHVVEVALKCEADYDQFPEYFFIHNRKDDGVCYHTGKPIERIEVGGRGTYFSPSWQIKK